VPYWRAAQKRVAQSLGGEITRLHELLTQVSGLPDPADNEAAASRP
jgi:hypothetical protein